MANYCYRCGYPLSENGICSNCGAVAPAQTSIPSENDSAETVQGRPSQAQSNQSVPNPGQWYPYQNPPYGNQGYSNQGQPYPNQGYSGQYNEAPSNMNRGRTNRHNPRRAPNADWLNHKKDVLISGTRNMFAEILPILKAPISRVQQIAEKGNSKVGLEFVAAKTVIALLSVLIALFKLLPPMGIGDYVMTIYARLLLPTLLLTIGMDCLEALLLGVFTKAFNGVANFASMINVIGAKALYEGIILLFGAVMLFISPGIASILLLFGCFIFPYIEFGGYMANARVDDDRKPYVFFVVKACMLIMLFIIAYIFLNDMVSSLWGSDLRNILYYLQ